MIPEIEYADITVSDSHTLGYDAPLCVEGLYAIHEQIKTILNADNGFLEPPKVLNALYCSRIFGSFEGDDLSVLPVNGQGKDKKARAFFPAVKYFFELEKAGFHIFDIESAGMPKPKNKPAMLEREYMMMTKSQEGLKIVAERFGRDNAISVATMNDSRPDVRMVNAFYEDGSFYVVTYALSNKMEQIKKNPSVAVCGEWFTAHGVGENLGHVLAEKNAALIAKLREVFASWYSNGHTNESDPNTIILRIKLADGVIFNNGTKYRIKFTEDSL